MFLALLYDPSFRWMNKFSQSNIRFVSVFLFVDCTTFIAWDMYKQEL